MTAAALVRSKVDYLESGAILKYKDFKDLEISSMALSKALGTLVKENKLNRIEKGVFYKPKKSRFGSLGPNIVQVAIKELEENNQARGYITGVGLYNRLGLTTQISNVLEIAVNKRKNSKTLKGRKIKYVERSATINKENIPYLQLLDAIKDIKKIPDSDPNESYKILSYKIENFNEEQQEKLVTLSFEYSPMTRALLGSILEDVSLISLSELKASMNPLTTFKININLIKNRKRWNIK